jgi:phosphoenolpyruvate synthase/pyruvate phosphate dikinase
MVEVLHPAGEIVWLGDLESHDVARVGAKAAHLSRLAASYPVPDGFSLTADASLRAGASSRLPAHLRVALAAAYAELGRRAGVENPAVAVRSSAIDEDGPTASFAGQHETLLNVIGVDALMDAVEACWASARSEQALGYRRLHDLSTQQIGLAVLVQQLVVADTSGVVFSANPVSGSRDEIIVTASWGLGESIVGGTVTPDTWAVRPHSLDLIATRPGLKRRMTIPSSTGTREVDVPRMLSEQLSLSREQVLAAAELAMQLEASMGWPVDIECAWSGGQLYLLQCRPITTLGLMSRPDTEPGTERLASAA